MTKVFSGHCFGHQPISSSPDPCGWGSPQGTASARAAVLEAEM